MLNYNITLQFDFGFQTCALYRSLTRSRGLWVGHYYTNRLIWFNQMCITAVRTRILMLYMIRVYSVQTWLCFVLLAGKYQYVKVTFFLRLCKFFHQVETIPVRFLFM